MEVRPAVDEHERFHEQLTHPRPQTRRQEQDPRVPCRVLPRLRGLLHVAVLDVGRPLVDAPVVVHHQLAGQLQIGLGVADVVLEHAVIVEDVVGLEGELGGVELVVHSPVVVGPAAAQVEAVEPPVRRSTGVVGLQRRRAPAPEVDAGTAAATVGWAPGDHVDHAARRVDAPQGRVGAAHHLHAFDHLGVDEVEPGEAVRIGHRGPVEQHHDLADAVARLETGAPDHEARVVPLALGTDQRARHPTERVLQVGHRRGLELLPVDHRHGGRNLLGRSFATRRGDRDRPREGGLELDVEPRLGARVHDHLTPETLEAGQLDRHDVRAGRHVDEHVPASNVARGPPWVVIAISGPHADLEPGDGVFGVAPRHGHATGQRAGDRGSVRRGDGVDGQRQAQGGHGERRDHDPHRRDRVASRIVHVVSSGPADRSVQRL